MISPSYLTANKSNGDEEQASLCVARRSSSAVPGNTFRHSLASQYSSTSGSSHSHRYSVASTDSCSQDTETRRWSGETGLFEHVPSQPSSPTSFSSLPPSSRYLLSGAMSSEHFREQELSRFYPSSSTTTNSTTGTTATLPRRPLSDPFMSPPPMSLQTALDDPNLIVHAWLYKHQVPAFAFARSWKKRYVVLIDKTLYIYKSLKPTSSVREHFGMTDDTLVFVSEEFKKSSYVLEIRKPLLKWYLRCDSADQLKQWLEAMKKVAACLKLGHRASLTASILNGLQLTDDTRLLLIQNNEGHQPKQQQEQQQQRQPATPPSVATQWWKKHQYQYHTKNRRSLDAANTTTTNLLPVGKRQSLAQIPNWEKTLPPQMPPPQRSPPPLPQEQQQPQPSITVAPPPPPPPPPIQSSLPPSLSPVSEDH